MAELEIDEEELLGGDEFEYNYEYTAEQEKELLEGDVLDISCEDDEFENEILLEPPSYKSARVQPPSPVSKSIKAAFKYTDPNEALDYDEEDEDEEENRRDHGRFALERTHGSQPSARHHVSNIQDRLGGTPPTHKPASSVSTPSTGSPMKSLSATTSPTAASATKPSNIAQRHTNRPSFQGANSQNRNWRDSDKRPWPRQNQSWSGRPTVPVVNQNKMSLDSWRSSWQQRLPGPPSWNRPQRQLSSYPRQQQSPYSRPHQQSSFPRPPQHIQSTSYQPAPSSYQQPGMSNQRPYFNQPGSQQQPPMMHPMRPQAPNSAGPMPGGQSNMQQQLFCPQNSLLMTPTYSVGASTPTPQFGYQSLQQQPQFVQQMLQPIYQQSQTVVSMPTPSPGVYFNGISSSPRPVVQPTTATVKPRVHINPHFTGKVAPQPGMPHLKTSQQTLSSGQSNRDFQHGLSSNTAKVQPLNQQQDLRKGLNAAKLKTSQQAELDTKLKGSQQAEEKPKSRLKSPPAFSSKHNQPDTKPIKVDPLDIKAKRQAFLEQQKLNATKRHIDTSGDSENTQVKKSRSSYSPPPTDEEIKRAKELGVDIDYLREYERNTAELKKRREEIEKQKEAKRQQVLQQRKMSNQPTISPAQNAAASVRAKALSKQRQMTAASQNNSKNVQPATPTPIRPSIRAPSPSVSQQQQAQRFQNPPTKPSMRPAVVQYRPSNPAAQSLPAPTSTQPSAPQNWRDAQRQKQLEQQELIRQKQQKEDSLKEQQELIRQKQQKEDSLKEQQVAARQASFAKTQEKPANQRTVVLQSTSSGASTTATKSASAPGGRIVSMTMTTSQPNQPSTSVQPQRSVQAATKSDIYSRAVCVSNLPPSTEEEDLTTVLTLFGDGKIHQWTQNKSSALVVFESEASAALFMNKISSLKIRGILLRVARIPKKS